MKRILNLCMMSLLVLLLNACSYQSEEEFSKRIQVNTLICPEGHSTHKVNKDLAKCKYYDEKQAARASESTVKPECVSCESKKGYTLE